MVHVGSNLKFNVLMFSSYANGENRVSFKADPAIVLRIRGRCDLILYSLLPHAGSPESVFTEDRYFCPYADLLLVLILDIGYYGHPGDSTVPRS